MHQYASAGIQGFGRLPSCYAEGTPAYLTVIENLEDILENLKQTFKNSNTGFAECLQFAKRRGKKKWIKNLHRNSLIPIFVEY
jgi:hypothetical protein